MYPIGRHMFPPHRYYYLQNFISAIVWVRERNGDLLNTAERRFMAQFEQLPQFSQALLVRMILRRGPWFLENKLAYAEIPDIGEAAAPLLELGWLDAEQPMTLGELFALHTKPELLRLFAQFQVHNGMRKAQILQSLVTAQPIMQTYFGWNPQSLQGAWRVMVGDLCERLRLMFFGNLHQSWSEFVLADLGIFKYEKVVLDRASRAFQCRNDIDDYLAIHRCRQALDEGKEVKELLLEAAHCASANPWLEARRNKLLLRISASSNVQGASPMHFHSLRPRRRLPKVMQKASA